MAPWGMATVAAGVGVTRHATTPACHCRDDHHQHRDQQEPNSHLCILGEGASVASRVAVVQYYCAPGGEHEQVAARLIISASGFGTGNMLL